MAPFPVSSTGTHVSPGLLSGVLSRAVADRGGGLTVGVANVAHPQGDSSQHPQHLRHGVKYLVSHALLSFVDLAA